MAMTVEIYSKRELAHWILFTYRTTMPDQLGMQQASAFHPIQQWWLSKKSQGTGKGLNVPSILKETRVLDKC